MNKYLHDGLSAIAFYQKMRAEGAALQHEMAYAAVGDEINRLRAENEALRAALRAIVEPFSDLNFVDGGKLLTFIHDTATAALAAKGE